MLLTTRKVNLCNSHFGHEHNARLTGKTAFCGCWGIWSTTRCCVTLLGTCSHWTERRKHRAEGFKVMRAYKSGYTSPRPYAYLDDLCSVRWHVIWSIAVARQAWRVISGGQQQNNLLKNSDAASKSFAFFLPVPPLLIRLFIYFLILCTSRQATVICMMWSASAFSCSFFFWVCVCVRPSVAVCHRVCLWVLMRRDRLPESACFRGRSKKQTAIGKIGTNQQHSRGVA